MAVSLFPDLRTMRLVRVFCITDCRGTFKVLSGY